MNKEYIFLIAVLLLFTPLIVNAQTPLKQFSVKDKGSHTPLPFTKIEIAEGEHVLFKTQSDNSGYFYIDTSLIAKQTALNINIEFIGYARFKSAFNARNDSVFYLEISAQTLEQVTISAKRKLLNIENNKIVYDIAKDSLNNRGSTANAMRQIPGLEVSITGNEIKAGTKNILYLLNGQEDAMVSSGRSLSSLPARFISKIELITDPDPKYKERGYDLIINILSTADIIEGNLGNINAGADSRKGYSGSVFFFHRKNNFSISINGRTANNKNSASESTEVLKTGYQQKLSSSSSYKDISYSNSLELNYVLKKSLLYAYGNYGTTDYDQDKSSIYTLNAGSYAISGLTNRYSNIFKGGLGIRLNAISKRSNGTIGISYSDNPSGIETSNNATAIDSLNSAINSANWRETILQGTFTTKLNPKISFDYGLQGVYRSSSSTYHSSYTRTGSAVVLSDGHTIYDQNINSAFWYVKLNPNKVLQLSIGARAEQSGLSSTINSSEAFDKKYLNILPRLNLSYKTTKTQVLTFSYRQNLQRPSAEYISPFVNTTNTILQTTGNPDLKPELFQIFSFGYSFYWGNYYLQTEFYNSLSNNCIQRIAIPGSNSGFLYTYKNGGKTRNQVVYLSFGGPVTKKIRFSVNGGAGTTSVNLNTNKSDNIFYTLQFSNSYNLGKGFTAQILGFFNSASVQAQGYSTGSNMYSAGFNKSFHNNKSSLSLNIAEPLLKNRSSLNVITDNGYSIISRQSRPARMISLNYFYKFGKLKETYITRGSKTSTEDLKSN